MRPRLLTVVLLLIVFFVIPQTGLLQSAERPIKRLPTPIDGSTVSALSLASASTAMVPINTTMIAVYDFEDGVGGPDAQGWVAVDRTEQDDIYFHVDDFVGLAFGPLDGAQSMWCGVGPPLTNCEYTGYGNDWRQDFESVTFAVAGDVTLDAHIRYDAEAGFDEATVSYLSASGTWREVASFDDRGDTLLTTVIPADSLLGSAKIRFRFTSDGAFSDEDDLYRSDGAVFLDNIQLTDNSGVVDFQDFESEIKGALTTVDGDWTATAAPGFGNHAALFDGNTVVQEDTNFVFNNTNVWGFFNNSPDTYACGGHPSQPAVPFGPVNGVYLDNEIWSPLHVVTPSTAGSNILLNFDVYRDLPLDNLVFYQWHVRSRVNGCFTPWVGDGFVHFGTGPGWREVSFDMTPLIDPAATEFQVALGVLDACGFWCNVFGSGVCHSHAPLIDNIRIDALTAGTLVVTNRNKTGPGSLRDAIEIANAVATADTISFNIPGPGPHTIELDTDLPIILHPVLIDGSTQPGWAGTPLVEISVNPVKMANVGFTVSADNVTITELGIRNFEDCGIHVAGDNCTIQGTYIGADPTGAPSGATSNGIQVTGDNNVIGGSQASDGNLVFGDGFSKGIEVSGLSNRVEFNETRGGGIGILSSGSGGLVIQNTIAQNTTGLQVSAGEAQNNTISVSLVGVSVMSSDVEITGNDISSNTTGVSVQGGNHRILSNTISANEGIAVALLTPFASAGTEIRLNAIHNNGFGIDFNNDGITPNDSDDSDTGANNLQNFPVIKMANQTNSYVEGVLLSTPNTTFTIDIYANAACDPSGNGQGEKHIATTTVTTHSGGEAGFWVKTGTWTPGNILTATATAPDGSTSEFSACYTPPITTLVTSENDAGAGSLRAAIDAANAIPGLTYITFNIPGHFLHTINLVSPLPTIFEPVFIDGFSEPRAVANSNGPGLGSNANIRIAIDALNIGGLSDALFIAADNSTVRGLAFNSAPGAGIAIQARGCVIEGTYIGTNQSGTAALSNCAGGGADCGGIRIVPSAPVTDPQNNLIGGPFAKSQNVIAGNDDYGIHCQSRTTTIQGNLIGVDATGATPLPNALHGILLINNATECVIGGDNVGEGNVIGGNTLDGISIFTDDNIVRGNWVGTNATGATGIGNTRDGIAVNFASTTIIGGASAGQGNTVAFNGGVGVRINLGVNTTIFGNEIFDNVGIGIDTGAGPPTELVITSVTPASNEISGTVTNGHPFVAFTFTLQFFSNAACDPSGFGEGENYLGTMDLFVDRGTTEAFTFASPINILPGEVITATSGIGFPDSEFSACFTTTDNTPPGMNVIVSIEDPEDGSTPVTLTFDDVTGSGNTTLDVSESGPPPPSSFSFGDTTMYYDITTDAMFNNDIEVCITYDPLLIPGDEDDLLLLHYNDVTMMWDDITSSLDTANNILCGVTTSFSPFVIAVQIAPVVPTGIDPHLPQIPKTFALHPNAPNPFNPTTVIAYDVRRGGSKVTLRIYDVGGRLVTTLVDDQQSAGRKSVTWDGRNSVGQQVATGVYFYRMQAKSFTQTRKMILLK